MQKFQRLVFHQIHDISHPGIKATNELTRQRFVWNQMKRDIKTWVRSCITCQKGKIICNNRVPLQRFTLPSEQFLHFMQTLLVLYHPLTDFVTCLQ